MNLLFYFYEYGCGLWASSGPFPLLAHQGLYKRGRDPPINPSRHLKKERVILHLKWLLKERQGGEPTAATAAATAAAPVVPPPCPPPRPPPSSALPTDPLRAAIQPPPPLPPPPPDRCTTTPSSSTDHPPHLPLHLHLHLRRTAQAPSPTISLPPDFASLSPSTDLHPQFPPPPPSPANPQAAASLPLPHRVPLPSTSRPRPPPSQPAAAELRVAAAPRRRLHRALPSSTPVGCRRHSRSARLPRHLRELHAPIPPRGPLPRLLSSTCRQARPPPRRNRRAPPRPLQRNPRGRSGRFPLSRLSGNRSPLTRTGRVNPNRPGPALTRQDRPGPQIDPAGPDQIAQAQNGPGQPDRPRPARPAQTGPVGPDRSRPPRRPRPAQTGPDRPKPVQTGPEPPRSAQTVPARPESAPDAASRLPCSLRSFGSPRLIITPPPRRSLPALPADSPGVRPAAAPTISLAPTDRARAPQVSFDPSFKLITFRSISFTRLHRRRTT